MATIHLLAEIKANHGQEANLEQALLALLEPSRNEDGCCQYELFQDESIPGLFVMQEIWCSEAALAQHQQTEHFQHFVALTEENGWIEYLQPRQLKFLA
ncbi:antibiotic biosynthesis monooxygenase [Vibrio fluvialis]